MMRNVGLEPTIHGPRSSFIEPPSERIVTECLEVSGLTRAGKKPPVCAPRCRMIGHKVGPMPRGSTDSMAPLHIVRTRSRHWSFSSSFVGCGPHRVPSSRR